jgi:hypothetical protein
MDRREMGFGKMGWVSLAKDRKQWWTLVTTVMNFRVPQKTGNFLISSRRALLH